jgi:hypothetical protein
MNISPRTKSLLGLVPKNHALSDAMRGVIIAASAANEEFADLKNTLARDDGKTDRGKVDALKAESTRFGKALVRTEQPMLKARAEAKAKRDGLVIKAVDPSNLAAALERGEIRAWLRSLDVSTRQLVALGSTDPRILTAMVTAPPELSGIAGPKAAAEIEQRYIELTYPNELAEIEALEAVIAPAEQARHIARNEMAGTYGAHPLEFDKLLQSLEPDRPWLTSDRRQVVEIGADGKAKYHPATADQIENGRVFSPEAYAADRAA